MAVVSKSASAGKKADRLPAAEAVQTLEAWRNNLRGMALSSFENELVDAFNDAADWQKEAVVKMLDLGDVRE